MSHSKALGGAVFAAALVLTAGCSTEGSVAESSVAESSAAESSVASTTVTAPVTPQGTVVREESPPAIAPSISAIGAEVKKVVYRSTSGVDGSVTEVVGTVFTPPGAPPEGGWPIVTVGHGTTGVTDECAPSASPTLLGTVSVVAPLLSRGYVVAVTDYAGLGTAGPHPYLEPDSAGYNLIDAVRAARSVVPQTSSRWAALGVSQGGQASWSAAEHADDYGSGLEFVGAANLSPAADLSGIVTEGQAAALTLPQKMFLPYLIEGLAVVHPELDENAYIGGVLTENRDVVLSCVGAMLSEKWVVATQLSPSDTVPKTPTDADRMRAWLEAMALPSQAAAGPMLVVVGETDNLILPQWTASAVERACARGDVIDFRSRPGEGHADSAAVPGAVDWIADRFAGVPAPDTCAAAPTR